MDQVHFGILEMGMVELFFELMERMLEFVTEVVFPVWFPHGHF